MTEQELRRVHAAVAAWLRANHALVPARGALERLAAAVRSQAGEFDEFELHTAAALCALGPARPAPPLEIFRHFHGVARRKIAGRIERVLEVAIAYGCGCWREFDRERAPWSGEWDGAVVALARAAEPAVREVAAWVTRAVPGRDPTYWSQEEGREFVTYDASMLALHLTRPLSPLHTKRANNSLHIACRPDGTALEVAWGALGKFLQPGARCVVSNQARVSLRARMGKQRATAPFNPGMVASVLASDEATYVFPSRAPRKVIVPPDSCAAIKPARALSLWSCACGNRNCARAHRLDAWKPGGNVTLWSFVASAIKGPGRTVRSKALVTGMYFPLLNQLGLGDFGRLRQVPVEFSACQSPACRSAGVKYYGERCATCGTRSDRTLTPRRAEDWLILVPEVAAWERVPRVACPNDRNLFTGSACPLCGGKPRTTRTTWVWVPSGNAKVPFEAGAIDGDDGPDDTWTGDDDNTFI